MTGRTHHAGSDHPAMMQDRTGHAEGGHDHEAMIADFKRRFWVSLVLTVPILLLSPMIQDFLGLGEAFRFP